MPTFTGTYDFILPNIGGEINAWGSMLNANWTKLDAILTGSVEYPITPNFTSFTIAGVAVTVTAAELNVLDGLTATTAELNILDGVTATAAELNILDGATITVAELNILDGVTATAAELNILDGVTATAAELNILDGVTATAAELNILDGVTATAAELNILDGVTATAAELNILDGVTADATEINKLDGVTVTTNQLNRVGNTYTAEEWIAGGNSTNGVISPTVFAAAVGGLRAPTFVGDQVASGAGPIAFTVPDTATYIELLMANVRLAGTDQLLAQLRDASGYLATGYSSYSTLSGNGFTATNGFVMGRVTNTEMMTGVMRFRRMNSSGLWMQDHNGSVQSGGEGNVNGAGTITLASAITGVRLNRTGTDAFNNGTLNVTWA